MAHDGKNQKTLLLVVGTVVVAAGALFLLTQFARKGGGVGAGSPSNVVSEKGTETKSLPSAKKDLIPDVISQTDDIVAPDLLAGERPTTPGGKAKGFEYESPNDEGQLALRIRGGTTEPMPNGLIRIPNPQAWVYPSDDRLVYITGDEAEIEGTEMDPQAGTLIGHVDIRIFARDPEAGVDDIRALDIENTFLSPIAVMTAERVHFDRATNQISTEDHFIIRTDRLAIAGRGLTTVFNEIDNRIEYLRIEERESIVFTNGASSEGNSQVTSGSSTTEAAGSAPIVKHSESTAVTVDISETNKQAAARSQTEGMKIPSSEITNSEAGVLPYYRIVLSQGVTVVQLSNGEPVSVVGENLKAELSLDSSDMNTLFSKQSGEGSQRNRMITGNEYHDERGSYLSRIFFRPQVYRKYGVRGVGFRSSSMRVGTALIAAALSVSQAGVESHSEKNPGGSNAVSILRDVDFDQLPLPLGLSSRESLEGNDGVIVLGSGPLVIQPILSDDSHLENSHDMYGSITGSPVVLSSPDGEASCAEVEYRKIDGVATLVGSSEFAVSIHLADGGVAKTSAPVELNTGKGTVRFLGAGTFTSGGDEGSGDGGQNKNPNQERASTPGRIDFAGGVSASWTDSVTLTFDGGQTTEGSDAGNGKDTFTNVNNGKMGKIKSAEFRGKVRFEHSGGYTLEADQLTAQFDDYNGVLEEPAISLISGRGHVRVYSREGEVSGDQLDVSFALDRPLKERNDPQPSVVEFSGRVSATDTRNTLHADYLRIDLYQPSKLANLQDGNDDNNRVRLITAANHIVFDLEGGGKAVGDRLIVHQREGMATLSGESVIVSRDTMRLVAPRIELDQQKQTVRIVGAGVMTYLDLGDGASGGNQRLRNSDDVWQEIRRRLDRNEDENNGAGSSQSNTGTDHSGNINNNVLSDNGNEGQAVRISWQKNMVFNDESGRGEFVGGVLAESAAQVEEYNSIQADRLIFRLTQPIQGPSVASADRAGSPSIAGEPSTKSGHGGTSDLGLLNDRASRGGRRLIEMTATSESKMPAKIQAVRYTGADRKTPVSIFYVAGPIIEYFAATKRLTVTGTGSMFLYDGQREHTATVLPNDTATANTPAVHQPRSESAVQFSGRGRTLFKWTGSLILDGIAESMTIHDDVSVRHRSPAGDEADSAGAVDVWCQSLRSSLDTQSDDINVLSMSGQSTGRLQMLDAGGGVSIVTPSHEITADHLHFENTTKLAVLSGTSNLPVTVSRPGSPNSFEAERVFWDLYEDSITVEHPGAATMPTGGP